MKKGKKVFLLVLSAVLLVVASVLGTMAYLTDKDNVVNNTFTVGKVDITLDEAVVDVYGIKANPEVRTSSNAYRLIPGHTYTKDPTITVSGDSEECYIFVKIENGLGDDGTIIYDQNKKINWSSQTDWFELTGYGGVWVYNKDAQANSKVTVSAGTVIKVFDAFKFGDKANPETYKDSAIRVTAYAIQADGFENKTYAEIWTEVK